MNQPDPTNPAAAPELHGLDPGELLARGLNTVHPSGPVHHWTPPTPEELARLLPHYHIESLLGRGGMGAVYKGFQEKLARPVAIKILPAELTADEQFVSRFEREAKTLARLQHPGIVSIYDFGQTTDGHLYFVMEFVEGTDLQRILQGPGLDPGQALELITQICEALHAAHCQGVIHRDIKPANILITKDGRVKLADFGLARPDREDHGNITLSNVALGTPDYMAPEQRQGQTDLRADIYALGVMLYEMLTGQLPRGAWAPPSRKVTVDVRIDEVVLKALQLEPDLRYQQASEMKSDVDSIRSGVPPAARSKRPRLFARTSLLAAFALAAAVAVWLTGKSLPPSPKPSPALSGSLAGGIEDPIKGNTSLRRFVFLDTDNGLFKQIFLPVQTDFGLLVRLRCAADLMTDAERAQGYDISTVWEWVQVPPLGGGGENIVRFTQGVPVWHKNESGGDATTIRLVSGMATEEEIFSAERIAVSGYSFTPSPQGIEYTFRRKAGDKAEVFLQFEIIPVSHRELKAKYPMLRGPGETTGEVAMWIDGPAPEDKSQTAGKGSAEEGGSLKNAAETATLTEALFGYDWQYQTTFPAESGRPASTYQRGLFFERDGTVYSLGNIQTWKWTWTATGQRTLQIDQQFKDAYLQNADAFFDITFDPTLTKFTGRNTRGAILEGHRGKLFTDEEIGKIRQSLREKFPPPATLEDAMFSFQWTYLTERAGYSFDRTMIFLKDGTACVVGRTVKRKLTWTITGPKTVRLTFGDRAMELTFDDSLTKFTGRETGDQPWGDTAFESLKMKPLTEEIRNQILKEVMDAAEKNSPPSASTKPPDNQPTAP